MAKDPAFLFYPNDFLSGTQFMSDEQVGKYMRVLMAQHQHGHLTEKQVIFITKSYDDDIFLKLKKDEVGLYFNKRLEEEMVKRKNYTESRSKNKAGKVKEKIISKSCDFDMENENINENRNLNSSIKSDENFKNETGQETGMDNVRPIESIRHRHWPASSKECEDYFAQKGSTSAAGASFFRKYEAQNWMIGTNAIAKWKFKADEWISNPNKFGSTEPKKVLEITASDYDSIPQTSYGNI